MRFNFISYDMLEFIWCIEIFIYFESIFSLQIIIIFFFYLCTELYIYDMIYLSPGS